VNLLIKTITNSILKISVNSRGAELISLKSAADNFEYLWQPDPRFWKRQSPVLFPIVGALPDDRYYIGDCVYELGLHGFTKDSELYLVKETPTTLVYKLTSTNETLKKYPYHFELETCYELAGNELIVRNRVINIDEQTIWFSIGAHPGFRCPFQTEETMEDYQLVFEREEYIHRLFMEDSMLTGQSELFLNNEKCVNLSESLFGRKAIVLKGLKSNYVTLKSCKNDRQITLKFAGFPCLVIWSAPGPFICIEPWHGICSNKGEVSDLRNKEGIIALRSGQIFESEYKILIR
jgi:galactose mutarotase-like enzyme